jgi:hypothetical protein
MGTFDPTHQDTRHVAESHLAQNIQLLQPVVIDPKGQEQVLKHSMASHPAMGVISISRPCHDAREDSPLFVAHRLQMAEPRW